MKQLLLSITFFVSFFVSFSQDEVLSLPVNYDSDFYSDKESLALINKSNNELFIYIEDYKKTKLFLLDSAFNIKSKFEIDALPNSFKNYLGYKVNEDDSYSVFFSNLKYKKFGRLDIDFKTKQSSVHKLDFTLNFEGYVDAIMFKNEFYIFSVTKRSNDLHFYTYNDDGSFDKKTLTLDFLERKVNGAKKRASNLILGNKLAKIDVDLPNAIELTSNENKVYLNGEKFVFTFDNDKQNTIVVTIDPTDFSVSHDTFEHSVVSSPQFSKHNSYLFEDKIFQISSSVEQMKFTIKDYQTKQLVKEIVLNKTDSITFKNTPIILESKKIREMEATAKFLRRISNAHIGVSVSRQNNDLNIVLGGVVINTGGGGRMYGFGGMPTGGFGPLSVSFNPTFYAYSNYASSSSTYINCLFDKSFNHLEGEIEKNGMDHIKDYEDSFDSKNIYAPKAKLTNVFSFKDKLYFGYLNTEDRKYHVLEFNK